MYMTYFPLKLVFKRHILKTYFKMDTHVLATKMGMSAMTWVFYVKKEVKL